MTDRPMSPTIPCPGSRHPDRAAISRRGFLAGMAGAAAVGTQLATARASFGQPGAPGTLVVVFLRGGMDGLSVVVPGDDPYLLAARPSIAVPARTLLPLDRGFGLHPALAPLHELWKQGRFTAVPAVSTPDISRSHFQAQDCLERGGSAAGTSEGWLDRVLDAMEPGTTFRAISAGTTLVRALAGDQAAVALRDVGKFTLGAGEGDRRARTVEALAALYADLDHPLSADAATTLEGLDTAAVVSAIENDPAADYPEGAFAEDLAMIARFIKADVGMRVACVDLGGWDMHANLGTVDSGTMFRSLTELGKSIGAFARDLGDGFDQVNVVIMTEFGRRLEQNANAGTDHGHGAAVLLLGGGLAGGTVHGTWNGLAPDQLDRGDVPGWNDYRDVLAEVVQARLGVGAGAMGTVFPDHRLQPVGTMR